MAFTVLLIIYRKPDLSPSAFKSHYEQVHVPLRKLAGALFPLRHVRHYVARDERPPAHPATVLVGEPGDFGYVGLAEFVFANAEAFQVFSAKVGTPEAQARLAEDESKFTAEGKMRVVVMGETVVTEKE